MTARSTAAAWLAIASLTHALPWVASAQTRAAPLSLEFVLTLPGEDSPVYFAGVADVDMSADGLLVVLDALNKTIYRFHADGSFLDSLGKAGRGPGEFQMPVELEIGPAGEIAVVDGLNARVTYWMPDRTRIGDTRIAGWPIGLWWCPSGLFLKTARVSAYENAVAFYHVMPGVDSIGQPTVRFTFERDPSLAMRGVSCDFCAATVTTRGDPVVADPDPKGYRLAQIRDGGEVVRVWQRAGLPPIRFTASELERIRAAYRRDGQKFDPGLFKIRPRIAAIAMDDDGCLWVLRRTPEPQPLRLDVFDRAEKLVAELPISRDTRKFVVRRDGILTIGESPDGEPVVRVFRIVR